MAKFRISRPYTMPIEEVRKVTSDLATQLEEQHGIRARWEGDTVCIKGAGIEGKLCFDDGVIDIAVKLGMMTSIFEPAMKNAVTRFLDMHLT